MDSIISSALEEICSQGQNGVVLQTLWSRLEPSLAEANLDLSHGVKSAIWNRILTVPSLQFQAQKVLYCPTDSLIRSFEDAERMNLKVVAKEQLRDNFVGLYNVQSANLNMSLPQRRALERLAAARTSGITQSQLGKEFGIEGKNLFYVVRKLESQRLIVRQSAVVRTKESMNEGESKNCPCISTNLMYLYRYAKHLGCQQKLEITKEEQFTEDLQNSADAIEDGLSEKCIKEDVLVKDYLPAMKAVCDKLEEANGKVLVVSDIKKDLGYIGSPLGHKDWRRIHSKLKNACIVEDFEAKVNDKVELCLRLLKKFSSKCFEPNNLGGQYTGRKSQITDQLVELPIEHQIYDIIDAAGSKGMTVIEVCKQLGIDHKKNYTRLIHIFTRFGMHLQAENYRKVIVYRVWTPGNFKPESYNSHKLKDILDESEICNLEVVNVDAPKRLAQTSSKYDTTVLEGDNTIPVRTDREVNTDVWNGSSGDGESNQMLVWPSQESLQQNAAEHNIKLSIVSTEMDTTAAQSEIIPTPILKRSSSHLYQRYPCLPLTKESAQREQIILERLQDEKFILRPELYRWIVSHEKDKDTTMDRKTVDRILNKLQKHGLCKCTDINVPVVTNCGRRRIIQVVLHPSIQNLSAELIGQIHDKLRSFEILSRGQSSSRGKKSESLPVLKGVQRSQNHMDQDARAARSEAMRANGFILAKMVRAKLLHCFLWDYLSGSGGPEETSSSERDICELRNPHSSCKPFSLEPAIKSIPIELFLQIVGTTQSFDDMFEKCRRRLCLSDLSLQEYMHLMNTRATGRLSLVIDILQRLKLIRLVPEHPANLCGAQHTSSIHALELRPYIEEPLWKGAMPLNLRSLDFRPRIRHDFYLSSRSAVDEYWQTLEYCYAAADPRSALLAFPGSAVHEVFLFRSWASIRVMTAEQRAELLKRVVKNDLSVKLSYKECEKIAKELNLTLEQVLRVNYDRCQRRLNRFQGMTGKSQQSSRSFQSSYCSRKKSHVARPAKRARTDVDTEECLVDTEECLDGHRPVQFPETVAQSCEEQELLATSSGEHGVHQSEEHDNIEAETEIGPMEDDGCYSLPNNGAFPKMRPTRERRFSWTEEADRQLIIQYVRHHAAFGARINRTEWTSVPQLPAPPSKCMKRMASLLSGNERFRKAVMGLCNLLSKRYVKHLEEIENVLKEGDSQLLPRGSKCKVLNKKVCDGVGQAHKSASKNEPWDDFDDQSIKIALNEVLRYKKISKLEASKRDGFISDEWEDPYMTLHDQELERDAPATTGEDLQNSGGQEQKLSGRKSRFYHLHQRFLKILKGELRVSKQVYESLAVSNAVELFKLVFLSSSTAPEVPNLLAEILRRYSEHDLFSAFNYLRDANIMIGGHGNEPFMLSQQFLHSIVRSPFLTSAGKRASSIANWLHEREKDLWEGGINLPADLQCGDIFHLFALVSSGDLSISPNLPSEGVGESEDLSLKRKNDDSEFYDTNHAKKLKSVAADGEVISRREKGFPGIMVAMRHETIPRAKALELFRDGNTGTGEQLSGNDPLIFTSTESNSLVENMKAVPQFGNYIDSPWETLSAYVDFLILNYSDREQVHTIKPEIFKLVYSAIQKAGDQGLSLEEISKVINLPGEKKLAELVVDVLQTFRRALKVNGFDSVRVVDALYHSKYFLTSIAGFCQDHESPSSQKSEHNSHGSHQTMCPGSSDIIGANWKKEVKKVAGDVHKVTILHLPEEVNAHANGNEPSDVREHYTEAKIITTGGDQDETCIFSSGGFSVPILPWINGDGTINKVVYKGLRRRVLGIVMQNPGILEVDIVKHMDVLNPQSCKRLLEAMILDKHLIVRKMYQSTSNVPPAILGTLLGSSFSNSMSVWREHFFANPKSTSLL